MRGISVVSFLVLAGAAVSTAVADEVELRSGATFEGTVVEETDTHVVIETDIGKMRFGRDLVLEVRKDSSTEAGPEAETLRPRLVWSLDGVRKEIEPALAGGVIVLARVTGGVSAHRIGEEEVLWRAAGSGRAVAGLAADPGGFYVATVDGWVARLHSRNGGALWQKNVGGGILGAPLLHRRGVWVFVKGRGVVCLESSTGDVRGAADIPPPPDSPLTGAGDRVVFGAGDGRLFILDSDSAKVTSVVKTPSRWKGRAPVADRRNVVLGGAEQLVVFDVEAVKAVRNSPVPGLLGHPFASGGSRAFVEVGGVLAAVEQASGRLAWRATDAGRITHLTLTGTEILATTADRRLVSISRSDGAVEWATDLGADGACPPLVGGEEILVLTGAERLKAYRLVEGGEAPPPPAPEEPAAEPAPEKPEPRVVHSPQGYRIRLPEAWGISENVTVGAVSLGLRPDPEAPRFRMSDATVEDRRRFALTSYIAIIVQPSRGLGEKALAERYLGEERAAAKQGGYGLDVGEVGSRRLGSREWTEIRLAQIVDRENLEGRFEKRVLLAPFGVDGHVWLELKCPEKYLPLCEEDFLKVGVGFTPEDDFEPTADVRVAEAALAALATGNREKLADLVSPSLRSELEKGLPDTSMTVITLLTRASFAQGSFREVRVRVDTTTGTRYTRMVLAREGDEWVVVDLGTLL